MNTRTLLACVGALSCMAVASCENRSNDSTANAPSQPASAHAPKPVPADNTANNASDGASAATPLDQSQDPADIKVTADIRRAIMESKMSVNAQNCKIITANGVVTLRGVVDSQAEKDAIGALAAQHIGANATVDNQLEVKVP